MPNPSQNLCYSHSLNFHVSGSPESGSKQPTQLIVELNSSLRHIIVTLESGIDVAHSIFIRTVSSSVTIMCCNDELSSTMS